jgi:uncharacterized protein (TIGR03000 family)
MWRNILSAGLRSLFAMGLFGLACSSALAQAPSCLPYYYFPVAASARPAASTVRTTASSPSSGPRYGATESSPGQPNYYTEDYPGAANEKPDQKLPARIRIRVPADAEVIINGKKTPSTGVDREFETPELNPERVYNYLIKAKWIEDGITVEKGLKVRALSGNRVTINFVPRAQERPRLIVRVAESSYPASSYVPPPSRWSAPYP